MSERARAIAQQHIRQAIDHLVEARREMTLGELETFIRAEYPANGNGGFVASTCEAMVRGSIAPPQPGESNARFIGTGQGDEMSDSIELSERMTAALAKMSSDNRKAGERRGYAVVQKIDMLKRQGHSVAMTNIPGLFRVNGGPEITLNQLLSL